MFSCGYKRLIAQTWPYSQQTELTTVHLTDSNGSSKFVSDSTQSVEKTSFFSVGVAEMLGS